MNYLSSRKITAGFVLLLVALLFSLYFVQREVDNLLRTDDRDLLLTDSLLTLLREKDANTISLLRTLNGVGEGMIAADDIEQIIAQQDSTVTRQRVQHRIITSRDTILSKQKKKGFFRRLGEAFIPPKRDTAIQVKTSLEVATDTVLGSYNPADSLQEKLRAVARRKQSQDSQVRRKKRSLQQADRQLTTRIDSLLKGYEQDASLRARAEAEYQTSVRRRSTRIIGGIAVGAVLLSVFFLLVIVRDVARSNRYRHELEEARRRAEALLALREKLMLAITHDFKAPLGSIMGYADLLARLTVDERQRFYLDNMKTSSQHLLRLVTDLLDFHRLDLQKMELSRASFSPARLLDEIRVSFQPLATEKGLTLYCQIDEVLEGTFVSDPLRLRQVVINLLNNAVKFTDHGSVTLTARYEAGCLLMSVSDTGRGMDSADLERIFHEFTRLPGAQGKEGFGLGLSIVRMLVQLLEGSIQVSSVLGQGSTFSVSVPAPEVRGGGEEVKNEGMKELKDGEDVVQPQTSTSSSLPTSIKKLLLIDDDSLQLTLTAAMLQQAGLHAVCCQQLDELLDALRTDTFDALLTDVQMPAINGFDLLRLLRASNIPQATTIPIVAVTARSDMQPNELLAYGFSGCLHKPFTVTELLRLMGLEESAPSSPFVSTAQSQGDGVYNLTTLTVFCTDDVQASAEIMQSFATETKLNAQRLRQALEINDARTVAALSHKMLPLFRLIEAKELVKMLSVLELYQAEVLTDEAQKLVLDSLKQIDTVLTAVVEK